MARSSDIPDGAGTAVPTPVTPIDEHQAEVARYTAAGGDETVQRVVTAVSRLSKRLDDYYRQQLAELQMHRGDWAVLQALAVQGEDGSGTPSGLADLTGVSPSTMTHRLDLLTERGFVQRSTDTHNRTRSNVSLTAKGWARFRRIVQDADAVETRILSSLKPRDRQRLADLLEQLVTGLSD